MFRFEIVLFLLTIFALSTARVPRVLNGGDAELGQFPWHVGVAALYLSDSTLYLCSGALISKEWVLTSGYCIYGTEVIGVHAATINNFESDGLILTVAGSILHEGFDPKTLKNDIALVRVRHAIEFNDNVSSIALDETGVGSLQEATITGWGHSNHDDAANDTFILQFAKVSTIDNVDCGAVYGPDNIGSNVVCTVGENGETPCYGDAGGPLVVDAETDPVLVGIFSFISGEKCEYPAGYSRISYYKDWIRNQTGI